VPRGRVITYGAIARLLGDPRKAREVGWAMAASPAGVPAQRVVNARGEISGGAARTRRGLLEADGVGFLPDGRVDLDRYLWLPEAADLLGDPTTSEQARDGDEDDRTNYRDDKGFDIEAVDHIASEKDARQPATDNGAENAKDKVADKPVAATHDHAGYPAREQTDNNPAND
jgi:methylated-DNA-protein-cysteine methyltransferase-like protein